MIEDAKVQSNYLGCVRRTTEWSCLRLFIHFSLSEIRECPSILRDETYAKKMPETFLRSSLKVNLYKMSRLTVYLCEAFFSCAQEIGSANTEGRENDEQIAYEND